MISVIITTLPTENAAKELGKQLLDKSLIVCTNISKCQSQYMWEGKYHDETEFRLWIKTSISCKEAVIKFVKDKHPYETPLIASKNFEINNSYKSWMDSMLGR